MKNRAITIAFWTLTAIAVTAVLSWVHWRWRWMDQILGVLGSYASLVGLVMTWYVAVTVRQVKQRYVRRILLDKTFRILMERIEEFEAETTAAGLRSQAAQIFQILKEVRLHLSHDEDIQSLLMVLSDFSGTKSSPQVIADAKVVRPKLTAIAQRIELLLQKEDWGRDNG